MDFKVNSSSFLDWNGDILALGFFEDDTELTGDIASLNDKLDGVITELIEENDFKGKANSTLTARVGAKSPIRKVMLVGLGKQEDITSNGIRLAAGAIARSTAKENGKTLGIALNINEYEADTIAQMITEGVILALHKDNRFKSDAKNEVKLTNVDILGLQASDNAITKGKQISDGVILARELVNSPPNDINPITLAQIAQDLAKDYSLELTILEKEECEKLGMGAFLGVAQASDIPPKFVHLTYKPQGTAKRKVAIIGKGLTFDSGGLNLKVSGSGIETMKMDMGGAAATFGAAKAIAQLKPDVEVHFISAITENMISGKAMHPGDILTASNGKTIEVNNTDAEGRLTLADALVYADKLGVDAMVDLATLTGACIVALGNDIAGLWTRDDKLAQDLSVASEGAGEKFWQMPMETDYFDIMKSAIADMKNTGSRAGGSITAALFLEQFVENTPWVHLDVAGPVWAEKANSINNEGGTGFAVRTLVNWVLG
ncbi:leucyl aminopeptidase [Cyanobacterium stanieri LEGE 03274]|uniref:Probable cytosol aminopeptidase n=1 Tax=Cyanobacterium stanieri LEGE 03274 TaxID=1828756 RepID=A0ABR9V668_9CHRO|nr:leucyl aminopeptidase [Cyanobacterium stanieri]MBE9223385.1 leucyl aminopeptidase [Cyanobacterium stanieri LEGE 03274]